MQKGKEGKKRFAKNTPLGYPACFRREGDGVGGKGKKEDH